MAMPASRLRMWACWSARRRIGGSGRKFWIGSPRQSARRPALAPGRPVEHHPDREIVAELDEAVLDAGIDIERIARAEAEPLPGPQEDSGAGCDDVDFVLSVRRLRILALG